MPMYRRNIQDFILRCLSEFRIVYLAGPRQAGKTTLAQTVAQEAGMDYRSLDDPAILRAARDDPQGFVRSMGEARVVLDEFQYVPALVPAIKEASDRLPPGQTGKFLLTGSADIFRSAQTQEALPGHMARLELMPLSVAELGGHTGNLVDYLSRGDFSAFPEPQSGQPLTRESIASLILKGGYPGVQGKTPRARQVWYKSYTEGRFYKDFESLYAARGDYRSKLQALAPYLAGLCGNLLKYSNISNDLELDDGLSKRYLEVLELMFIIRRTPAWRKNRARRLAVRMPKLHYVDTGLACHLLRLRNEEQISQSYYYGHLLENLVFMELTKHAAWAEEDVSLYYFRDKRQHEVDIVLERSDGKIIGIEVKASATVKTEDFKGLAVLADLAGSAFAGGILLYTGEHPLPFKYNNHGFQALPLTSLLGDA